MKKIWFCFFLLLACFHFCNSYATSTSPSFTIAPTVKQSAKYYELRQDDFYHQVFEFVEDDKDDNEESNNSYKSSNSGSLYLTACKYFIYSSKSIQHLRYLSFLQVPVYIQIRVLRL